MATEILRDNKGHFLPGQCVNPTGRPPVKISMTKLLQDRLSQDSTAQEVVNALVNKGILERDVPAIREIFDRIDGKVADRHFIQGIIVHVGNEYAQMGLDANKQDLLDRQTRYLMAPSTNDAPKSGEVSEGNNGIP